MKNLFILLILFSPYLFCNAQGGTWTWVKGDSTSNGANNIGTMGVSNIANYPQGRYQAVQWTDLNGNFWIFGGLSTQQQELSDLWKYNPTTNVWTWMKGDTAGYSFGVYGTMGVPGPNNNPSARSWGARAWTDKQGHLWLHGGAGFNGPGIRGALDDLWMYDIPTNEWTWMKGNNAVNTVANYGASLLGAASNTPGALDECTSAWVKSDGTLWFFGGFFESQITYIPQSYNNVWKFDILTNNWTWMSGSDSVMQYNYGTLNVESPSNLPPGRHSYTRWQDESDNFYIFGGTTNGTPYAYNDVWKYNSNTNLWTWVGGDSSANVGHFTQQCVSGNGANPSPRYENRTAYTQYNSCNKIYWTFGGYTDSISTNDIWAFNGQSHEWTCVRDNAPYSYGSLNTPALTNVPPARFGCCLWADSQGVLWMWGGANHISYKHYNDMWKFVPDTSCIHAHLFLQNTTTTISQTLCPNQTAIFHGTTISTAGAYSDTFATIAGCDSIVILNLSYYPPTNVSFQTCKGISSFVYNNHNYAVPSIDTVTLSRTLGCDSIVILNLSHYPDASIHLFKTICIGDSLIFNHNTISTAGIYFDTLQTTTGCDSIVRLTVTVAPNPTASFYTEPVGDSIALGTITAINTSTNADTILWALNQQLISLTSNGALPINDTGAYCLRLVATSNQGCKDTSKFCFYVFENAFVMPNAFTPNGDGKNDFFHPVFINSNGVTINAFRIYNRWGQLIYNTDNPAQGWDGKYKGEAQPSEEYSYYISISLPDRDHPSQMKEINKEGSFSLFR